MADLTWARAVAPYKLHNSEIWWTDRDSDQVVHAAVYGKRSSGDAVFLTVMLPADASAELRQSELDAAAAKLTEKGLSPEAVSVNEGDQIRDAF